VFCAFGFGWITVGCWRWSVWVYPVAFVGDTGRWASLARMEGETSPVRVGPRGRQVVARSWGEAKAGVYRDKNLRMTRTSLGDGWMGAGWLAG
jgi:hypothetical protein